MLSKALKKAKDMNIALDATKLVNFMLHRAVDGSFDITINCLAFAWEESHVTTMYWSEVELNSFKEICSKKGLRTDYSFLFNLLVWNFLNKYNA